MTSAVVVVAGCASTQSPGIDLKPRNTIEVLGADDQVVMRVDEPNTLAPSSQPIRVAQADTYTGKKMGNGWVITVYPWGQEAMVGRFVQQNPSPIKIEGHESFIPKVTPVIFEGQAIFLAKKPGKYVFIKRISVGDFHMDPRSIYGSFSVNDDAILSVNTKDKYDEKIWFETDNNYTASVTRTVELSPGEYNVSFEFGARKRSYWSPNEYTVELLVIEPGASQPRHLQPQQVIHYRN